MRNNFKKKKCQNQYWYEFMHWIELQFRQILSTAVFTSCTIRKRSVTSYKTQKKYQLIVKETIVKLNKLYRKVAMNLNNITHKSTPHT